MIDFTSTSWNEQNLIEFYNEKIQVVKTYPMEELEAYVTKKLLNLSYEWVEGEKGEPKEVEVYEPVIEYIDNNWDEVTKSFYMAQNPSEYQSANRIQETRKALR